MSVRILMEQEAIIFQICSQTSLALVQLRSSSHLKCRMANRAFDIVQLRLDNRDKSRSKRLKKVEKSGLCW